MKLGKDVLCGNPRLPIVGRIHPPKKFIVPRLLVLIVEGVSVVEGSDEFLEEATPVSFRKLEGVLDDLGCFGVHGGTSPPDVPLYRLREADKTGVGGPSQRGAPAGVAWTP
jgi:hypothetical protein